MTDENESPLGAPTMPSDDEETLRSGFLGTHRMAAQNDQRAMNNAVDVVALTELLISKGIINVRELSERQGIARGQLAAARSETYAGPILHTTPVTAPDAPPEKLVDCDARYRQCRGACCILYNVYLTADEVTNGNYRWDLSHPYRLKREPSGHCTYLDRSSLKCTIWDRRPSVCRQYSCQGDERVWVDFERRVGTGAARHLQAPPDAPSEG